MLSAIKTITEKTLKRFDIAITRHSLLKQLEENSRIGNATALLMELPGRHKEQLLKTLRRSKSQLGQDLFVLSEMDFKTNGYFVDFGATNGVDLSNSYLLEKEFGWNGIVAEPARRWHKELKNNRNCHIETSCVWRDSNATLTFNETRLGEFSTIDSYSSSDDSNQLRKNGKKYNVSTISLVDLLDKYDAPGKIDYLSIDTEGSEFEILKNFDFNKYQFAVITCEHNFALERESIFSLLTQNGYVRKFDGVSGYDDWYVNSGPA
jgi:FkbM family methyltransferase